MEVTKMAMHKLGQVSHNAINDLQQKHFDMNMKLGEIMNDASLDVKAKIVLRLPGLLDEIKAELESRENDI